MATVVLASDPPITVTLKRNARTRRLSLRVSRLDGQVTLSLPRWTPEAEAVAFMREKEAWIRRQLAGQASVSVPVIGGSVLFEGKEVPIVPGAGRSANFTGGELQVPGNSDRVQARIAAFLKTIARQRLISACDVYSDQLNRSYGRLTIRDTRSRWGSCSSEGNLMFSWRLVMAPVVVLEYVAAHEVAHLVEMNHSADFWNVVARICPTYREPRKWLRDHGQQLHAYRFAN